MKYLKHVLDDDVRLSASAMGLWIEMLEEYIQASRFLVSLCDGAVD